MTTFIIIISIAVSLLSLEWKFGDKTEYGFYFLNKIIRKWIGIGCRLLRQKF